MNLEKNIFYLGSQVVSISSSKAPLSLLIRMLNIVDNRLNSFLPVEMRRMLNDVQSASFLREILLLLFTALYCWNNSVTTTNIYRTRVRVYAVRIS